MLGLIVRVLVLCSVVFAIVYAFTRAKKDAASSKEARRIAAEVRKLREAITHGQMAPAEYAQLVERIRSDCQRLGIAPPDLPSQLPPRDPRVN